MYLSDDTSISKEEQETVSGYLTEIKEYVAGEALSDEVTNMSEDSFSLGFVIFI